MANSWDKFEYLAENDEINDKNDIPETLYTEKKGRNKKCKVGVAKVLTSSISCVTLL